VTPAAATGAGHYGASADYQILYRQCGITAAAVAAVARDSIRDAQNGTGQEATGTFAPAAGGTAGRPA
jgi:transketolase